MDDQRADREGGIVAPRYSLKSLLLSITLITGGTEELVFVFKNPSINDWLIKQELPVMFPAIFILYGSGVSLICAGVGALFRRTVRGLQIGGVVVGVIVLLLLINYFLHPAIG